MLATKQKYDSGSMREKTLFKILNDRNDIGTGKLS